MKVEGYKPKEGEDMNPSVNARRARLLRDDRAAAASRGASSPSRTSTGAPRVAIINETMATYFFGDRQPARPPHRLGARQDAGHRDRRRRQGREDVDAAAGAAGAFVYTPYMQEPEIGQMTFYVRARGDASSVGASVRQVAQRVDPNLPIFDMKTMTAVVDESLFLERMVAALSVAFGGAGDAARRDRPLRRDVVHGRAADARDRHPHGARRRAQLGDVAGAERGRADGRHRRRRRPAAGDRAQPRRAVAAVRSVGARSGRARRRRGAPGARRARRRLPARRAAPRASIRCWRCGTNSYSYRRATRGSTRNARRAGTYPATRATAARAPATIASVAGS